ncbi:MAG: response regulator [Treponema sp.]|jgi:signal transduction histidine kinase/CheY-like chemotaxis protein|nr:response regulator [Treponema sp.]
MACAALFLVISLRFVNGQIDRQIDEKMSERLKRAALGIASILKENEITVMLLAAYAERASIEDENYIDFIKRAVTLNKSALSGGLWYEPYSLIPNKKYASFFAYRRDDDVLLETSYENYDPYFDTEWYQNGYLVDKRPAWSATYYDPLTTETMLTVTMPFKDKNGKILGVATIDLAISDLRGIIKDISLGETGRAILIDSSGEYVSFLDDTKVGLKILDDPDKVWADLGAEMMTNRNGIANIALNRHEYSVYYSEIQTTHWIVALVMDKGEIVDAFIQEFLLIAAVIVAGMLGTGIGVSVVTGYIVGILKKVNHFAEMGASGLFTERIEIREKDEFGDMENYLNRMMENMSVMNESLSRSVEAEKTASRAKGDFLSRMSHEIRTPLNAILGMSRIARESSDLSRIHNAIDKVTQASKHLLALVNDILDMSKIEANKLELCESNFDLKKGIEQIYSVISIKAEEKDQRFELFYDEKLPTFIIADYLRFTQVITNLLSNAIKFTPEKKTVRLELRLLQDDADICSMEVRVVDTGIGISKEMQQRLFGSFEQANAATSAKYGGTGLGLAISKSIITLMHGDIWVESEEGKGSVFIFQIPIKKGIQEASDKEDVSIDASDFGFLNGKTLLIAEDIDINREVIAAMFEGTGAAVEFAENGVRACELFAAGREKYNAVLMDFHMPLMDGLSAARNIRAMPFAYAATVPIIAMTADAFTEDVEKSRQAGMNDHISKPIDFDVLMRKLKVWL